MLLDERHPLDLLTAHPPLPFLNIVTLCVKILCSLRSHSIICRPVGLVDHNLELVVSFLKQQIEEATKAERPLRGPFLAKMELVVQLKKQSKSAPEDFG